MIFEIIVCDLALYHRYNTGKKQLKSINTEVYSLKRSQVQRFLKTHEKWFVFATFSHCDKVFCVVTFKKVM
jgi:hypothetical protein